MAILSIDLAWRRWSDLGIVILSRAGNTQTAAQSGVDEARKPIVDCEIVTMPAPGLLDDPVADEELVQANVLAGRLNHLCGIRDVRIIMLDGPQAWKSKQSGLEHSRIGERELNLAAKTGLPGLVKPLSYRPLSEFCIDVYDALVWRGWKRLTSMEHGSYTQDRVLVESSPASAWKSLGLQPLRSKRRTSVSDLAEAWAALNQVFSIRSSRPPNHDQLQAIVAGLPGLALEARDNTGIRLVGEPPRREEGGWREGLIALPVPPQPQVGRPNPAGPVD